MTKIVIGSLIEFVPDQADVREARLLDLIEEHMGKDMRRVMEEYIVGTDEVARLEDENYSLRERLDEARERITGLEESLEEALWNRGR